MFLIISFFPFMFAALRSFTSLLSVKMSSWRTLRFSERMALNFLSTRTVWTFKYEWINMSLSSVILMITNTKPTFFLLWLQLRRWRGLSWYLCPPVKTGRLAQPTLKSWSSCWVTVRGSCVDRLASGRCSPPDLVENLWVLLIINTFKVFSEIYKDQVLALD